MAINWPGKLKLTWQSSKVLGLFGILKFSNKIHGLFETEDQYNHGPWYNDDITMI